jgi:hypothetical protein
MAGKAVNATTAKKAAPRRNFGEDKDIGDLIL